MDRAELQEYYKHHYEDLRRQERERQEYMQMNEPEAPSPAPVPQPSVIYAEPIENHNNGEIIQLKEKLKVLEEENKSLKKYILSEGRCPLAVLPPAERGGPLVLDHDIRPLAHPVQQPEVGAARHRNLEREPARRIAVPLQPALGAFRRLPHR